MISQERRMKRSYFEAFDKNQCTINIRENRVTLTDRESPVLSIERRVLLLDELIEDLNETNPAVNRDEVIPESVLQSAFSYLHFQDISRCICVCKQWANMILENNQLWFELCSFSDWWVLMDKLSSYDISIDWRHYFKEQQIVHAKSQSLWKQNIGKIVIDSSQDDMSCPKFVSIADLGDEGIFLIGAHNLQATLDCWCLSTGKRYELLILEDCINQDEPLSIEPTSALECDGHFVVCGTGLGFARFVWVDAHISKDYEEEKAYSILRNLWNKEEQSNSVYAIDEWTRYAEENSQLYKTLVCTRNHLLKIPWDGIIVDIKIVQEWRIALLFQIDRMWIVDLSGMLPTGQSEPQILKYFVPSDEKFGQVYCKLSCQSTYSNLSAYLVCARKNGMLAVWGKSAFCNIQHEEPVNEIDVQESKQTEADLTSLNKCNEYELLLMASGSDLVLDILAKMHPNQSQDITNASTTHTNLLATSIPRGVLFVSFHSGRILIFSLPSGIPLCSFQAQPPEMRAMHSVCIAFWRQTLVVTMGDRISIFHVPDEIAIQCLPIVSRGSQSQIFDTKHNKGGQSVTRAYLDEKLVPLLAFSVSFHNSSIEKVIINGNRLCVHTPTDLFMYDMTEFHSFLYSESNSSQRLNFEKGSATLFPTPTLLWVRSCQNQDRFCFVSMSRFKCLSFCRSYDNLFDVYDTINGKIILIDFSKSPKSHRQLPVQCTSQEEQNSGKKTTEWFENILNTYINRK